MLIQPKFNPRQDVSDAKVLATIYRPLNQMLGSVHWWQNTAILQSIIHWRLLNCSNFRAYFKPLQITAVNFQCNQDQCPCAGLKYIRWRGTIHTFAQLKTMPVHAIADCCKDLQGFLAFIYPFTVTIATPTIVLVAEVLLCSRIVLVRLQLDSLTMSGAVAHHVMCSWAVHSNNCRLAARAQWGPCSGLTRQRLLKQAKAFLRWAQQGWMDHYI